VPPKRGVLVLSNKLGGLRGLINWYNGNGRLGQVYIARLMRVRISGKDGGVGVVRARLAANQ
jgi:hypothetical protein